MRAPTKATARLVLVLSTMLSMLLATAAPALASDVAFGAVDAVCADDDSDGISFSVGTDREGEAAEHPAIRVEWKPAGLDDDAYQTLGTGPLSPENGYTYSATVTGLDFGDATQVTVRATALRFDEGGGPWGDGRFAGDKDTRTISVEECGDGDPGEDARMNFTAGCETSAGEPAAILFNEGEPGDAEDLTFEVDATFDGLRFSETVVISPGASETVLLVFVDDDGDQVSTEDGSIDVRVTVGDTVLERIIDVDCEDPEPEPDPDASVAGECTATGGAIVATMSNPTDADVTFVVTIDGDVVDEVTLAAGADDVRQYAVADGSHTATIEADGAELADAVITIECDPSPSAAASTECDIDQPTILVTLTNPDPTPSTFTVSIDGTVVDTIVVTGGSEVVSYPVADGDHTVEVSADGEVVYDELVNATCGEPTPEVESSVVCQEDGGLLTLTVTNPGPATTAVLTIDGITVTTQTIPEGATTEMVAGGLEDGARNVVLTLDGAVILDETVDVDCVEVQGVVFDQDPPVDPAPEPAPEPEPAPAVAGTELPNAGVQSVAWVLFALLLVFFGGDLVLSELRTRLRRR